MTTDVTNIQNAFMMLLRMGMRAPVSLIIAVVIILESEPVRNYFSRLSESRARAKQN